MRLLHALPMRARRSEPRERSEGSYEEVGVAIAVVALWSGCSSGDSSPPESTWPSPTGDLDHIDTAKSHIEKALSIEPEHWHAKRHLNNAQFWASEVQKAEK